MTTFSYDANGNRTGVTRPNGYPITYTYDALNRQTDITYTHPDTPDVAYAPTTRRATAPS